MNDGLTIRSMPCGKPFGAPVPQRPFSVDVDSAQGDSLVIVGGAGTGKTACAYALSGLSEGLPPGMRVLLEGKDLYGMPPERRAKLVGFVPCQPHLIFSCIAVTVRRELELSFAFLGLEPDGRLIDEIGATMRIGHLMDRHPLSLSGGEKVRLAVALGLLKTPAVMIFDDALRELDPQTERDIREALGSLRRERGLITVEFQTRPRETAALSASQWVFLSQGGAIQGTLDSCWRSVGAKDPGMLPPYAALAVCLENLFGVKYIFPPDTPEAVAEPFLKGRRRDADLEADGVASHRGRSDKPRLSIEALSYHYPDNAEFRLGPVSATVKEGSVTALLGQNGAGKTTLLRCVGNLLADWAGDIVVLPGLSARETRLPEWAKTVLYCFQNPDDQLFLGTVREEMGLAARYTRDKSYHVGQRVEQVAAELGLSDVLESSPADLPRPFRRLLTLGAALVANPPVLLLDEPTVDLDEQLIDRVSQAVLRYRDGGGTVLLVSHDYDFVGGVCDEVVLVEKGAIARKSARHEGAQWPLESSPCVTRVAEVIFEDRTVWSERDLLDRLKTRWGAPAPA